MPEISRKHLGDSDLAAIGVLLLWPRLLHLNEQCVGLLDGGALAIGITMFITYSEMGLFCVKSMRSYLASDLVMGCALALAPYVLLPTADVTLQLNVLPMALLLITTAQLTGTHPADETTRYRR